MHTRDLSYFFKKKYLKENLNIQLWHQFLNLAGPLHTGILSWMRETWTSWNTRQKATNTYDLSGCYNNFNAWTRWSSPCFLEAPILIDALLSKVGHSCWTCHAECLWIILDTFVYICNNLPFPLQKKDEGHWVWICKFNLVRQLWDLILSAQPWKSLTDLDGFLESHTIFNGKFNSPERTVSW